MPVFTRKLLATGISLLAPLLTMVTIASCTPNQEPTQPPEAPEQPPVESELSLSRTYTSHNRRLVADA
ncbi:MAG: hypothetical protein VKL39_16605 [Leptolyngbyaceae bacterium]|nr:hypothetical protein [Leptolyngbyaceae bacterium]